jgi:acetyltransferase
MFAHVSAFYRNQRMLMQTPGPLGRHEPPDVETARRLIASALEAGRTTLSSAESKSLLSAFRIPVAATRTARSRDEAVAASNAIGFPVAVKIDSPDITHKTDVGGVRLGLRDAAAVEAAYDAVITAAHAKRPNARVHGVTVEAMVERADGRELMIGVVTDNVFGPAVTFGTGGTAVEVLGDRAVGLPPLNAFLAADMIRSTRAAKLLGPFRGMPPADLGALENILLRVSEIVCELPWVGEMDLNPVLADASGAIVLDARVVVTPRLPSARPYDHMAIHPYPIQLVSEWRAPDGTPVTIRPIRPEDAEIERDFVRSLSPESRYLRFMGSVKDLTPAMLARFTQVDYDREMALIAVVSEGAREVQIGVARYAINADGVSCEFAVVVSERWQGRGLGQHLMLRLIDIARSRGLRTMTGQILARNSRMLELADSLGFVIDETVGGGPVREVSLSLS